MKVVRAYGRGSVGALIICGVAGAVNAFSLAWPVHFGPDFGKPFWLGSIVAIAVLYALVAASATAKLAIVRAAVFSFAWLSSTVWWLFVAMHQYAGLNAAVAVAAVALLSAAMGLYYACAIGLFWQWKNSLGIWRPFVFSAMWTLAELARGTYLSGFGWGAIGYSQIDGPLVLFAPWVGVYGVGAVVVLIASLVTEESCRRYLRLMVLLVLVVTAIFVPSIPRSWTQSTGTLEINLLQGNIPQDEKFEPGSGIPLALHWYHDQLLTSNTQLTIAPETAIPLLPVQLPTGYWDMIESTYGTNKQALLIGIPLGDMSQGYTNSVLGLSGGDTRPWRYNKHHLVPFGEYIPPFLRWFTQLMQIPLGDFESGPLGQEPFEAFGQKLGVNICYEDLFGEELAVRFRNVANSPNIFVNHSNIGWFGDTVAIDQHLHISRMRALEFERSFVRATNTGATAIVNHQGYVAAELPRYTRGVLRGQVEGRTGLTPYAWWVAQWGLWPLWFIALLVCFWAWRRNKLAIAGMQ